jgi:hypothetical protein
MATEKFPDFDGPTLQAKWKYLCNYYREIKNKKKPTGRGIEYVEEQKDDPKWEYYMNMKI